MNEFISINNKGRKKTFSHPSCYCQGHKYKHSNAPFKTSHLLPLGNNLVVFVKVTSFHYRILFASYSLDSTNLSYSLIDIFSRARA